MREVADSGAGASVEVEVVVTPGLGNATYLLGVGGDALVVDAPRDAWRLEPILERRGWRLRYAVETHVHNDYLSGALECVAAHGATVVAPARGGYAFAHRGVDAGDEVALDGLRLVARATPGHTPEHLAWDVLPDGATGPTAVLTGGSLLVGSVGRTDLLGPDRTDELTAAQFRSLRALAALPGTTGIWPTHGAGSFCAAGPTDRGRTSTVEAERSANPLLRLTDEAAFRSEFLAGLGPYPAYYAAMAPMNRAGPAILGRTPRPAGLTPAGLRAAVSTGAHVIDARPRIVATSGHIPGSISIELGDTFASYVGWALPVGSPLVLVLPEPIEAATEEAVNQLLRIGFDRVEGVLDGGVDAWVRDGGQLAATETVRVDDVATELAAGEPTRLLDVRDPIEWRDEGFVPGATAISVGDLIAGRVPGDGEPAGPDRPWTVLCRSGARAAIAASVLEARGEPVRVVLYGGIPDSPDGLGAGVPWPGPWPGP